MDPEDIDHMLNFLREFNDYLEAEESGVAVVIDSSNNQELENQPEPPNANDSDDDSDNNPPRYFHPSPASSTSSLDGPIDPLAALITDVANLLLATGGPEANNMVGLLMEPSTSGLGTLPVIYESERGRESPYSWLITPRPNPVNPEPLPIVAAFFILILMILNQDSPPPGYFHDESL